MSEEARAIIEWLESPEGQAWSESFHKPVNPSAYYDGPPTCPYFCIDALRELDAA